tara:strand:- start:2742 stop:2939 length:198 start_codon:yes stop_codon:yes gene_type:complete
MDDKRDFINSKLECPICALHFAKNYLLVHLTKQHSNIYGTKAWDSSRYKVNYDKIKKEHKDIWNK